MTSQRAGTRQFEMTLVLDDANWMTQNFPDADDASETLDFLFTSSSVARKFEEKVAKFKKNPKDYLKAGTKTQKTCIKGLSKGMNIYS